MVCHDIIIDLFIFSVDVFPYFLELLSSQSFPQEICFQQNFFQQLMKHTWRSLFSFIIDDQLLLSCLLGMTSVKNAFFRALPELFGTKCIVGLFLHTICTSCANFQGEGAGKRKKTLGFRATVSEKLFGF